MNMMVVLLALLVIKHDGGYLQLAMLFDFNTSLYISHC